MPARAQGTGALTGAPQIARVYDAILDARFDDVPALLNQACPPAPREVCTLLDTVALWWQIQLDPDNASRDSLFLAKANAAIASMEAWTKTEPRRAEAWFYLGGAYGARANLRVLRHQVLSAARDGKRIKEALERSLALDPALDDAYFGIGLYHYYAGVAPAAARLLRFLLLLPGGDKVQGLQEMLRARDGGQLLRSEADYQLHIIYIWYEHEPLKAIALVNGLRATYPHNPHFPQVVAEITDTYLHDTTASLRGWQELLELARGGRVHLAPMAETRARIGMAVQLDRLYETDLAVAQLRAVVAANPSAPAGAVTNAQQLLRRMETRLADPGYRLSIEGWRALERGALDDAARALARSISLRPNDPVTRYRQARLLIAQRQPDAALPILEGLVRQRETTPPTFYADACVDAARIHEQRGDRTRARELYENARTVFGADQRTKDAAQRAAARLDR
jgi:tetratricopeptide (TPR) repeat protein